jgi:hypothetical protein
MARLLFKDDQGVLHTVYGVRGIRGDGIKSATLNDHYGIVFTTDDGKEIVTGSVRGPQGAPGRDGLPDGSSGLVLLNLNDTDDAEYPVAFRSTAFDTGVEEVIETLGFDEFTYNPSSKTLSADHVVAQVSDSISAVTSVTEGDLESGDTLRDLFGKIRRKFGEIKDFVKNDLATTSDISDATRAVASTVTAALKSELTALTNVVSGKSDQGHKHAASDITSGVLPEVRGGTGASALYQSALGQVKTATLLASGWTGSEPYTQEVAVSGMLDVYKPIISRGKPATESKQAYKDIKKQWGFIDDADSGAGKITFKAYTKPTIDIPIEIKGV